MPCIILRINAKTKKCEVHCQKRYYFLQKWANFKPETRREHCIKELYDTETNYLEKALDMIINKFYAPLEEVLSPDDHRIIFMNIVVSNCALKWLNNSLMLAAILFINLMRPRLLMI